MLVHKQISIDRSIVTASIDVAARVLAEQIENPRPNQTTRSSQPWRPPQPGERRTRGDGEMRWWYLRDDEVELVGRREVADAGAGDGRGLVRRHHVVPFPPHRPSPASEAAATDAPRGRARRRARARTERAVWRWWSKRRNPESAAGCLVEVELGRSAFLTGLGSVCVCAPAY